MRSCGMRFTWLFVVTVIITSLFVSRGRLDAIGGWDVTVMAHAPSDNLREILEDVAIADDGDVAFVARKAPGPFRYAAVHVSEPGTAQLVEISNSGARRFAGIGVSNASEPQLVHLERVIDVPNDTFLIRKRPLPGSGAGVQVAAGTSGIGFGFFNELFAPIDMNDLGVVAFVGRQPTGLGLFAAVDRNAIETAAVNLVCFSEEYIPNPEISSTDGVTSEVVILDDRGRVMTFVYPPPDPPLARSFVIAGPAEGGGDGYTSIGGSPGISKDGRAIAFSADGPSGRGIYVWLDGTIYLVAGGAQQVAPSAPLFEVTDFPENNRVGISHRRIGQHDVIRVVFLATACDRTAVFHRAVAFGDDGPDPRSRHTTPVTVAMRIGDSVSLPNAEPGAAPLGRINALKLHHPLNARGQIGVYARIIDTTAEPPILHDAVLRAGLSSTPPNLDSVQEDLREFTRYSQRDDLWSGERIGASRLTFRSSGCTVSAFTTAIGILGRRAGLRLENLTPSVVAGTAVSPGWITSRGHALMGSAFHISAEINSERPGESLWAKVSACRARCRDEGAQWDSLLNELREGRPVLLAVPSMSSATEFVAPIRTGRNTSRKLTAATPHVHYVLAYAYTGEGDAEGVLIADPGRGEGTYGVPGRPGFAPGYSLSETTGQLDVQGGHLTLHDYFAAVSFKAKDLRLDCFGRWGLHPERDRARIKEWFNDGVFYAFDSELERCVETSFDLDSGFRSRILTKFEIETESVPLEFFPRWPSLPPGVEVASPVELVLTDPESGRRFVSDPSLALDGDSVLVKSPRVVLFPPEDGDLSPELLDFLEEDDEFPTYELRLPIDLYGKPLTLDVVGVGDGDYSVSYQHRSDDFVPPAPVDGKITTGETQTTTLEPTPTNRTNDSPNFQRGDANSDSRSDLSDAVHILNWLFLGGLRPACLASANNNGDSRVDVSDASYLLSHLFLGAPPPAPPFPDCGTSKLGNDMELGCEESDCQ